MKPSEILEMARDYPDLLWLARFLKDWARVWAYASEFAIEYAGGSQGERLTFVLAYLGDIIHSEIGKVELDEVRPVGKPAWAATLDRAIALAKKEEAP